MKQIINKRIIIILTCLLIILFTSCSSTENNVKQSGKKIDISTLTNEDISLFFYNPDFNNYKYYYTIKTPLNNKKYSYNFEIIKKQDSIQVSRQIFNDLNETIEILKYTIEKDCIVINSLTKNLPEATTPITANELDIEIPYTTIKSSNKFEINFTFNFEKKIKSNTTKKSSAIPSKISSYLIAYSLHLEKLIKTGSNYQLVFQGSEDHTITTENGATITKKHNISSAYAKNIGFFSYILKRENEIHKTVELENLAK